MVERFPEVPGYRIERALGEGGMARVYLATQKSLDRLVAIKVFAWRGSGSDAMAQRFEQEARLLARLEHPGIVGIFEVGHTADQQPFYAMAYLPNGDLSSVKLGAEPARIGSVLIAIAEALGFAHAQGVVHRDVKPENVLFDREHKPRLADFGISRSLGSVRVTRQGDALGSAAYMSPEQSRGVDVDARSDWYALGVVAFELLTGALPFRGDDAVAMALAHHGDPVPRLPAALSAWQPLIDAALAKLPEQRIADASSFIALVKQALSPNTLAIEAAPTQILSEPTLALPQTAALNPGSRAAGARVAAVDRRWPVLAILLVLLGWLLWPKQEPVVSSLEPAESVQDGMLLLIDERIAAQHWFEPVEGSAAGHVRSALAERRDEPRLSAADRLLSALTEACQASLLAKRDGEAVSWIAETRRLAKELDLTTRPVMIRFEHALAESIALRLQGAEAARDPTLVRDLDVLLQADPDWAARHAALVAMPHAGQLLRDANGPAMRLLNVAGSWLAVSERETSRGEYRAFARASGRAASRCGSAISLRRRNWEAPGFEQTDEHPVVCVSFDDARAYAAWLSTRSGQTYRLPSAAEWRAAAAGVASQTSPCLLGNVYGRDEREINLRERHDCVDHAGETSPGGRYRSSRDGLFDLVGNAAEWVSDCASGSDCGERRIMGSSWRDGSKASLLGQHDTGDDDQAWPDVGFRLVREIPEMR